MHIVNLHCQLVLRISGRYYVNIGYIKTRPNVEFSLYLKKAGLASRNIVHLQKIILRCVGFCFYILLCREWNRKKSVSVNVLLTCKSLYHLEVKKLQAMSTKQDLGGDFLKFPSSTPVLLSMGSPPVYRALGNL